MTNLIVGAGMAGCLTAYMMPNAPIIEREASPPDHHRAVLRFRGTSVSDVTNIPFRKVRVHKSIWENGREHRPTPRLGNLYSQKVSGQYHDRSIWNIETVERYVAPPEFHLLMLEHLEPRITYGAKLHSSLPNEKLNVISTIPMPALADIFGESRPGEFKHTTTLTYTATISNADVHCTVYYPGVDTTAYRATLTGDKLIVECVDVMEQRDAAVVFQSLGLNRGDSVRLDMVQENKYGKIVPIDSGPRRAFIMNMTLNHNVYSVGRYATWRNILLDDVVDDVKAVKRLITSDGYHRRLQA
jgi:hypothetical protein